MAHVEGTDPDIQTRPIEPAPTRHEVPADADLDALEDDRDPADLADDRGPLPETAADHPVLPDDEREVDDGYLGEEDVFIADDEEGIR
ncbi:MULTISPECIES: hypothetical protein [Microbacterium]|nr:MULTISPECIES: hypothetical protein [Microbacterium]MDI6944803.1 hypothetical protein [Microbacterium barkeri]MDR6876846.1 hypothetical protein [Microbacterium barkeri]WRH16783.1 hypothetical protein GC092_04100 [Microbacterium sp. JZ37]